MKAILYTTAAALIAIANPAQAQLLGGGAGPLGGSPIPTLPQFPTMPSLPTGPIGTATTGTVNGAAGATASKSVDARTGKANANGSANGSATGGLTQSVDTPLNAVAASANGSGSAAGSANADAQLIGTDAVRGTVRQTRDAAGNTVTTYRDRAGNLVSATRDRAGNLLTATRSASGSAQGGVTGSGNANGSSSGGLSGLNHSLALAGSAAAASAQTFEVKPGTTLFDMNGERLGKVREVFADGAGRVKGLLVKTEDGSKLLPAGDLAANGESLVTSLSKTQLAASGAGQANGASDGSADGIFAGLSHNLALAGSAAAETTGSFDLKSGTELYDMAGEKIGKVKDVVADANGRVKALVVKAKDATATLPAANFAANGDVLVTVMTQAQVAAAASQQATGSAAPAN